MELDLIFFLPLFFPFLLSKLSCQIDEFIIRIVYTSLPLFLLFFQKVLDVFFFCLLFVILSSVGEQGSTKLILAWSEEQVSGH